MSKKEWKSYIQHLPTLLDSAALYGPLYFYFLPDPLRNLAIARFSHRLSLLNHSTSSSSSSESKPFSYASSSPGMASALDDFLQPLHPSIRHNSSSSSRVLVLVSDYYEESLQLLDHVYATSLFSSPLSTSTTKRSGSSEVLNSAEAWQEQDLFSTPPSEMKAVMRLLEGHEALYQTCLKSFFLSLSLLKIQE
jgi:hypothetical protein